VLTGQCVTATETWAALFIAVGGPPVGINYLNYGCVSNKRDKHNKVILRRHDMVCLFDTGCHYTSLFIGVVIFSLSFLYSAKTSSAHSRTTGVFDSINARRELL